MSTITTDPSDSIVRRVVANIKTPKLRTMRQFAEQELVIPGGPFQGRRFKVDRNPFVGLLLDAFDSGQWRRFCVTGPTGSGKTLFSFILPILYHLFEIGETVVVGVPLAEQASDKWQAEILPAIEATKYRDLLPMAGAGSRGGKFAGITFKNGQMLKFMSGGGSDKKRASFHCRVLVITETDGLDVAGGTSREGDKVSQLERRVSSFGEASRVFLECTTSTKTGRTWREYTEGTESKIVIRCQHCRAYVTPEREHLTGWQGAADMIEAGEKAAFSCPNCGVAWTEEDRIRANIDCRVIHKGQSIDAGGIITGMPTPTTTLGFRWNAANNLLVTTKLLGQDEWRASREADEDNADKVQRQFVWAMPAKEAATDLSGFDVAAIMARATTDPRGRVPSWCRRITVGCDVGKWLLHWAALAWGDNGTPHVLDYARLEVPSASMAEELAIQLALRRLRDEVCNVGWESDRGILRPEVNFIDCGYRQDVVRRFAGECVNGYFAAKGFGDLSESSNRQGGRVVRRGLDSVVVDFGDGLPGVVEIVADAWKTWLHARLQTPVGQPGALTLCAAAPMEHLSFAKHLTAEKKLEEFVAGKGLVTRWQRVNRNNHFLDAAALAGCAGWWAGERLIGDVAPPPPPQQTYRDDYAQFGGQRKW